MSDGGTMRYALPPLNGASDATADELRKELNTVKQWLERLSVEATSLRAEFNKQSELLSKRLAQIERSQNDGWLRIEKVLQELTQAVLD